jgi:hypothetical protein
LIEYILLKIKDVLKGPERTEEEIALISKFAQPLYDEGCKLLILVMLICTPFCLVRLFAPALCDFDVFFELVALTGLFLLKWMVFMGLVQISYSNSNARIWVALILTVILVSNVLGWSFSFLEDYESSLW